MGNTFKARERQGSPSLDLTIPVDAVQENDIHPGDIFELEVREEEGDLVLRYRRVYQDES